MYVGAVSYLRFSPDLHLTPGGGNGDDAKIEPEVLPIECFARPNLLLHTIWNFFAIGMNMEDTTNQTPPSPGVVKCGRLVFYFVGFGLMAIPLALVYGDAELQYPFEWLCLGAGIVIVISGAVLPQRIEAHVGFDMPLFLPRSRFQDIDADD
ncbi:hypothetical protein [Massilia soli]|uniref:Uncharacterized protein n=1 Tax=Massilia soli TaxID=2792854 RepID=A0ABS7SQB9_9BURK|nr:hypothetical protein [Massilia soli]MBZ2208175.1 hypothetical protein [Massilia soli]